MFGSSLPCGLRRKHVIAVGFSLLMDSMGILEIPSSVLPRGSESFPQSWRMITQPPLQRGISCLEANLHGGGLGLVMFSLNSLATPHPHPAATSAFSSSA